MPDSQEKESHDLPFEFLMEQAPADFQEIADDSFAAKKIGRIISEAMLNGPWTGC